MKTLFLLTVFMVPIRSFSAQLENYRPHYQMSTQNHVKKMVHERAETLRDIMGLWPKLNVNSIELKSRSREQTSSEFIKTILSRVSEGYQRDAYYDKPISFDPSLFQSEIQQKVSQHKTKLCKSIIGQDQARLFDQIYHQKYQSEKRQKQSVSEAVSNAKKVAKRITDYIQKNDPELGDKSILSRFGSLYQVEAVDGIIDQLHFSKLPVVKTHPEQVLPYRSSVSLSLEMLSSVLSGYDFYFLEGQQCLIRLASVELSTVQNKINTLSSSKLYRYVPKYGTSEMKAYQKEKSKLQDIKTFLQERQRGAQYAHRVLSQISSKQRWLLFQLFLQFRGKDIPVSADIAALKQLPMTRSTLVTPEFTRDLVFYTRLSEELYRVEEYVREYVKFNKVNQKLISEIKGAE